MLEVAGDGGEEVPRAALAVLDTFASRDVLADNRVAAQRLSELAEPLHNHAAIKSHRHLGMIWAWDVDSTDPTFAARYHRAAMAEGVLLRPIGHTLYFMPPYALTESDQAFLVQAAVRALDKTLSEGAAGAHGTVVAMA